MNNFFEIINNADLIKGDKVNTSQINKMSAAEIIDFAQKAIEFTSLNSLKSEKSIFSHSSSISLSGGIFPCKNIDCRSKNVGELAQFAALYSDRIFIRNYFADYLSHGFDNENETIKRRFADDLTLFLYLQPLILNGNIVPVTPPQNYCTHCLIERSLGEAADSRLERAEKKLIERYNKDVEYKVSMRDGKIELTVKGPKNLISHTTHYYLRQIPELIKKSSSLMNRLNSGSEVILSKGMVREIESDEMLASDTLSNIAFDLSTSQCLGTSFLTERIIDIQTLREITGDNEIERRNQIIQKHLTCLVPAFEGVTPTDLLTLRYNEEDSFIVFRGALNKTIDEYMKNKKDFSEQDARAIYSDIIHPQLSKLNIAVKNTKINSLKKYSAKLLSWGGAISFGLYGGFLPSELVAAATALGLVPLMAELANDIMSLSDSEKEIRKEDFYFLWKATR